MRAFLAVDLDEELKERIFKYSQCLAREGIKLVEKENLHLTLVFLGEINERQKEELVRRLKGMRKSGEIRVIILGLEFFPDKRYPFGIWVKIGGEMEKLRELHKKVVDVVLQSGVEIKGKDLRFSPHITLARFKDKVNLGRKLARWELEGESFLVKSVTLFKSELSSSGPKYTKIEEFAVK